MLPLSQDGLKTAMSKPKNLYSPLDAFSSDPPAAAALVSALVDGEVPTDALPAALAQVAADSQLAQTWERYYLLREAIRGGLADNHLPDFSEKVMTAVAAFPENDPSQAKPSTAAAALKKAKKPPKTGAKVRSPTGDFSAWWPALSLAATFGLVVLLWPVVTSITNRSPVPTLATFLHFHGLHPDAPPAVAVRPLTTDDLAETLDADWPILLREHAAYQEVLPTMLPYTRMPMLRTASTP